MDTNPFKQFEEMERLARLADPMRQLKGQQNPLMRVQEVLERNPMLEAEARMKALRLPDSLPGWLTQSGQDSLLKHMEALTTPLAGIAARMDAYAKQALPQVQALLEPFKQTRDLIEVMRIQEAERIQRWSTISDDLARRLREWPRELRAQLDVLFAQGWCLDSEMPLTTGGELAQAFLEGEEIEAQNWLMDWFTDRLDAIEQTLVERHPARAAVVAQAFDAHRRGDYALSIPVFLIQAEGVVQDRHRRQLFSKNSQANLKLLLNELPDDDMRAILIGAFYVDIPLTRNTRELPEGFAGLNRHGVLHGTDPNYATLVNSLRAVSLLNFASYLVIEEAQAEAVETQS